MMGRKETEEFHNSVERGIFIANKARKDIHQEVVVLSTRVK